MEISGSNIHYNIYNLRKNLDENEYSLMHCMKDSYNEETIVNIKNQITEQERRLKELKYAKYVDLCGEETYGFIIFGEIEHLYSIRHDLLMKDEDEIDMEEVDLIESYIFKLEEKKYTITQ